MKYFKFKSIKTRLVVWFLLLSLIPLLVVLFTAYNQRVSVIQERTFDKLTVIRDLKVKQLETWLHEREGDIRTVSNNSGLADLEGVFNKKILNENDRLILENSNRILNRYMNNYPDYSELFVINPLTAVVELSTNPDNIGKNKTNNLYYTQTLLTKDYYIKDIHLLVDSGNDIQMTFSIPIFNSEDNQSRIIGILVARVDLHNSLFEILLERTSLGETGETLIVNREGFALNELRFWEDAPLKLKIKAEPAKLASEGNTGITTTTDYRGVQILAAYTYIEETGWGFVSKQDLNELYTPIREMIYSFIWLFLISAILIVLFAISLGKSIAQPIADLCLVAQKIGKGDFSVRSPIDSVDESGFLSQELNKMAALMDSRKKIDMGVSIISETIIGDTSIEDYSNKLLKQLMEITNASISIFYVLDKTGEKFEHIASIGANKKMLSTFDIHNPEGEIGNAVSKKNIYYLRDIPKKNYVFNYKTTTGEVSPKEIITIPIMDNSTVVALISLVNVHVFSKESYELIKNSWTSMNTTYSSLLANEKTRSLAENLSKINNELSAQSQEMEVQASELHQSSEELKEQNVELEAQKAQLHEASRLKSTFLSNMSHELRTPLNSVIALSGVLSRKLVNQISEEEYKYLSVIKRNGKHLLSLINDILDISRIESGHEEILISEFNVNGLITELLDMLHQQAVEKNIELNQIDRATELLISSDAHKCRHILQNLIGNAVKFTDKGKVEISIKKLKDKISISVTDTGIGISKKMVPHIFDEFHQVDGTTSRRFEGTGLGLTIAKKYANLLGGLISVKSTLGKGSEFTLTIPLVYKGGNVVEEKFETSFKPIPKKMPPNLTYDFSSKTILVVDDSEPVIIQVKFVLNEMGYKTLVARDGNEALEIIKHTIPDGIVLDLMMPNINGFEVLKNLRAVDKTAHVPVLILTAKLVTKQELKFLKRNNVHQLIQKGDIKRNELLNTIAGMVFPEVEKIEKPKRGIQNIKGKPVVLVVEDNPDNMLTVKAMLENKFTIIEAIDGKEGVKMAKKHKPNLILMDIALPKMDGYQAFNSIRAIERLEHIPMIALTASAMAHDREAILAHGFDAYIAKPIEEKIFYGTIDKVIYGK